MITLPSRRTHLWAMPWLALSMGLLGGFLLWPVLNMPAAAWVGLALGLPFAALRWYAAWRSDFGPLQWFLSALEFLLWMAAFAALVPSGLVVLGAPTSWALTVLAGLWASLAVAAVLGAWLEYRALVRAGAQGTWWRATVDLERGVVGNPRPLGPAPSHNPIWWLLPLGLNLSWMLEGLGIGLDRWWPMLLAGFAAMLLWVAGFWVGPLAGQALAVRAATRDRAAPLVHRDLARLQALRRGEAGEPVAPREAPARRLRRWRARAADALLQAGALLGVVGGLTLGVFEAWPAIDQARRWPDYRTARLVVSELDLTVQRVAWIGRGAVDDEPVVFAPGELTAVLGPNPTSRLDPAFDQARARLPIRLTVRWNPDARRRLQHVDARADVVASVAGYASAWTLGLLVLGIGCGIALQRRPMPGDAGEPELRRRRQDAPAGDDGTSTGPGRRPRRRRRR